MLHVLRRHGGTQAPRQAPWETDPLALDVTTGVAKQLERAGKLAKLDANFLKQSLGVALDRLQTLLTDKFGERNLAGDVGDGGEPALGARASARLAATARLSGAGRRSVSHGVLAFPSLFCPSGWELAPRRRGIEPEN